MRFTRRHLTRLAVLFAAAMVVSFPVGYLMASHSSAYRTAHYFAMHDKRLARALGQVRSCRLEWLGYSVRETGPLGTAEFSLDVIGDHNHGVLTVKLDRDLGEWEIKAARLQVSKGPTIDITHPSQAKQG